MTLMELLEFTLNEAQYYLGHAGLGLPSNFRNLVESSGDLVFRMAQAPLAVVNDQAHLDLLLQRKAQGGDGVERIGIVGPQFRDPGVQGPRDPGPGLGAAAVEVHGLQQILMSHGLKGSLQDLMDRVLRFWGGLQKPFLTPVILVTHAGPIRAILAHLLKIPPREMFSIPVDFGSITGIAWESGWARVDFMNQ